MIKGFEDFQKLGKDNMDLAMKSFGMVAESTQAIASEWTEYSRKAFEDSATAFEKTVGAKSLDKAFEVQTDYAKTAYEGYVGEVTKIGEMYADLAKDVYAPVEKALAKVGQ